MRKPTNNELGKLAHAAYYEAIGGRARERDWDALSIDERFAWCNVGVSVALAVASADQPAPTETAPLTQLRADLADCNCPCCCSNRELLRQPAPTETEEIERIKETGRRIGERIRAEHAQALAELAPQGAPLLLPSCPCGKDRECPVHLARGPKLFGCPCGDDNCDCPRTRYANRRGVVK